MLEEVLETLMSLATVPLSTRVRVTGVRNRGSLGVRLMEMGLLEGAQVEVVGRAPLGDPLRVRLDGCDLSLRCADAELIDVDQG